MAREVNQNWRIYVMDADGSNELVLTPAGPDDDTSPVWSPEGRKIAFVSKRDGNRELYVMDVDGQNPVNITRHPADDWTPAWSPDGSKIAFSSFRDGSWEIYLLDTACLSQPDTCPEALTQVTADGNGNLSPVWSPDGTRLAYNSKATGNWDIYTIALNGTDIRQVTVSPANDLAPIWSPDGSQIAFESNADGNVEIYVIGAVGGTPRNITNQSQANDHGPTWSPDGQQLIFTPTGKATGIFSPPPSMARWSIISPTPPPAMNKPRPGGRNQIGSIFQIEPISSIDFAVMRP
jgi:TolB protein